MRTIGFVVIILGGLMAYLGYQGRLGQAWSALRTGQVPTNLGGNIQMSGGPTNDEIKKGPTVGGNPVG